jgi:hypothetical protein
MPLSELIGKHFVLRLARRAPDQLHAFTGRTRQWL